MSKLILGRLIETVTRIELLKTRVGELTLKKPQFLEMPFQTKIFDRYSRVEKALVRCRLQDCQGAG
jgi:hypothetical protein